jgi:hypothetical protein
MTIASALPLLPWLVLPIANVMSQFEASLMIIFYNCHLRLWFIYNNLQHVPQSHRVGLSLSDPIYKCIFKITCFILFATQFQSTRENSVIFNWSNIQNLNPSMKQKNAYENNIIYCLKQQF